MMALKRCPLCGAKAYLSHDVVDGFDFGFSAGCPRYCVSDGIHGIETFEEDCQRGYSKHGFYTKEAAGSWWNRRAE